MGKGIIEKEFEDCLKKKRIIKFSAAKRLSARELNAAREDLKIASESLKKGADKWATIQAYYAMFHTARALLYSRGYREKSHYCLIVSMKVMFVKETRLHGRLVEAFHTAKILRENADYANEFSKESACSLIQHAEEFLASAKKILRSGERTA